MLARGSDAMRFPFFALIAVVRDKLLTMFGDIKVYPKPLFVLYDPGGYLLKGGDIRQLIHLVRPGDIMVRGFLRYLDGYCIPGYMSHAALYLGPVPRPGAQPTPQSDIDPAYLAGEQIVIHAMAEGVFMEDILTFSRCDYLIVLRPKLENLPNHYFDFPSVYDIAVQNLGKPYDFGFNFLVHDSLSCTEFVYDAYAAYMDILGVTIKSRRMFFITKDMLIPDDFITPMFDIVWMSQSVDQKRVTEGSH